MREREEGKEKKRQGEVIGCGGKGGGMKEEKEVGGGGGGIHRMWIKKFLNVNIINFENVDKPEGGGSDNVDKVIL